MNRSARVEYVLFFFSILFLPKIGVFDTKVLALLVFMILSVSRSKKVKIYNKIIVPIGCIVILILLFAIHSMQNETDPLILLRYVRCIITTVCIMGYINARKPDEEVIVESLCIVLCLHAAVILLSVTIPAIRPYIYVISGYTKKYLPLRSTGLLSGYDFAGYFLNAGILMRVIYNAKYKNRVYDLTTVLYIVATLFTSRVNTIILMLEMVGIIIYMFRTKRISSAMTLIIIIPIILVGSVFSILTIDTFYPLKNRLLQRYQWVATLDRSINLTYADSTIGEAITRHYDVEENIDMMFGNGITPKRDPGIIKTIYEGGFFALVLKTFFYLYICMYAFRRRNDGVIPPFLFLLVILTTLLEMKLAFYFATGAYELLITMFSLVIAGTGVELKKRRLEESNYKKTVLYGN